MRKYIARIAILAVCSLSFIGIASAAPASAANCYPATIGGIFYDSNWGYDVALYNCTGVSGVMFLGAGYTPAGYTIIYDLTRQQIHYPYTPTVTFTNTASSYITTVHYHVWGSGCGSPPFSVNKFFGFRLRNSNGGSWGPEHQVGPVQQMLC